MCHSLRAVSLSWLIVLVPVLAGSPAGAAPIAREPNVKTTVMDMPVDINVTENDSRIVRKTVSIVRFPQHGRVGKPRRNGTVTYTPDSGFSGQDTFGYRGKDKRGRRSKRALVRVTVLPRARPPVANNDTAATAINTPVVINVVANDIDSDRDLDPQSVAIATNPASGGLVNRFDGTVTYTPSAGFFGTDAFAYTVGDRQGAASNVATVTVTVTVQPPPPPPVITSLQEDSGRSQSDNITNDDTPTLSGTAATGIIEVTLYQNGIPVAAVPVSSGAWSHTTVVLPTGDYAFTATGKNAAGQESSPSDARIVTVDTIGPTLPSNNGGGVDEDKVPGFICEDDLGTGRPFLIVNGTDEVPVGATVHKVADNDNDGVLEEDDRAETLPLPRGSRYATEPCSRGGVQGVGMDITDDLDPGRYNVKFFVSDVAGTESCAESIETPDEQRCVANPNRPRERLLTINPEND